MNNINNSKVLETINRCLVNLYIKNLKKIKTSNIKLFTIFPYTGAPDLSSPVTITLFKDPEKILPHNMDLYKN